jgi:hypothetical protein
MQIVSLKTGFDKAEPSRLNALERKKMTSNIEAVHLG